MTILQENIVTDKANEDNCLLKTFFLLLLFIH